MSLGRRLLNVAKAELEDAARRLKTSAEQLLEPDPGVDVDPELEQIREQVRREEAARAAGAPPPAAAAESNAEIRRYYANLELPLGASAGEVRAAYRRLMRRYHPDKHALDPAQAKIATEVSQELRTAYEGLLAHLGDSSP